MSMAIVYNLIPKQNYCSNKIYISDYFSLDRSYQSHLHAQ
jgi:hypothetical protein